jgi:hypothetical protein
MPVEASSGVLKELIDDVLSVGALAIKFTRAKVSAGAYFNEDHLHDSYLFPELRYSCFRAIASCRCN